MRRTPLIVANWKMNLGTPAAAQKFLRDFLMAAPPLERADVVICPPYTALAHVANAVASIPVSWGAQNCHFEDNGAFTGEISAAFLIELNCRYVIVGHSERRQYFAESNALLNRKLAKAFEKKLTPIYCVGETEAERDKNLTFQIVGNQLQEGLESFGSEQFSRLVIAYEPVWAIGTGKTATPAQAQEVHGFIRERLKERCGAELADKIRILYGGSVKPGNTKDLMAQADIDGALVGGASLLAKDFADIVKSSLKS